MKTRNFVLLAALLICSVGISTPAFAKDRHKSPPTSNRSLGIPQAGVTITEGECIEAFFKPNTGMVSVVIRNKTKAVMYHKVVNTSYDSSLYINTSGLPKNSYTISILDEKGKCIARSDFAVD